MAAIAPYLPQELVDSIIDHVHNDRPTLSSCALVSRSWLHSSRYHLFATISLTPQPNITAQRLCARLYQLLQESPSIVLYIRQLQLLDGLPPHQHSGQWVANERTLPPLLKLLTHLKSLEISASSGVLQWKSLPFTLQNAICTVLKLPSLTYFRLYSCTFPNLTSLAAVLSLCQNLKGLSLSSVTVCDDLDHHSHPSDLTKPIMIPLFANGDRPETEVEDNGDSRGGEPDENTMSTRVATTPRLEVLTLDNVNFGCLGYLVLAPPQSPSPINFRNLRELRVARSADPFLVEQILVSIGPSLEHLHLKPGSWDVYPFDLRNNINLRSLRLTLEVPETALSWCTTLLSSLSPPTSRSLATDSDEATTPRLRQISFEFWTDLKRLAVSSTSNSTTPSSSPHHVPLSLSPATTPPPHSSSPPAPPTIFGSQSTTHTRPLSPDHHHHHHHHHQPPVTTPRSKQQPHTQSTWSSLDSILSHLPSPLKEVNIGLFAQPSHPDFIRVKEALSGIHARMYPDDLTRPEGDENNENDDDHDRLSVLYGGDGYAGGSSSSSSFSYSVRGGDDDDDDDHHEEGNNSNDRKNGVVRVYQLGLKSQRSFGRICGPRLRSFEGLV